VRIAIDATSVPLMPAGAGIYAIELVRAMALRHGTDSCVLYSSGCRLDEELAGSCNWRVEQVRHTSRLGRLAWEQTRLPRSLLALKIDVLHSTHHTLPLRVAHCARVVTIHDMTFFRLPERYPLARRLYMQTATRLAARVADAIIVPSNAVRNDVVRVLRVPSERVVTVYEAAAARFVPAAHMATQAALRRHGIDGPYVLSVGSLEPGKNRGRLIQAMRQLRDAGYPHRLVVVGQKAWMYKAEFELVTGLGMQDRVMYLGYVADDELPALYSGATAFAYPSLYEGFGLTVVEAMACGVPVLTSNVSATAEVAGDAALLVDPLSVGSIGDGLRRLIDEQMLRAELIERGRTRATQFSWRRAADETYTVYEQVARRTRPYPSR
jgi:glycosyltransferase involved in cell wall biosynthesis